MNLNFLYQHYVALYCQKTNAIQETARTFKEHNQSNIEKKEEFIFENFQTFTNKIVTSTIILNNKNDNESIYNSETYDIYRCRDIFKAKQLNIKESITDKKFNSIEKTKKKSQKEEKKIDLINKANKNSKILLSKQLNQAYSKLIKTLTIKSSCISKNNNIDNDDNFNHYYLNQINEKITNSRNLFYLFNVYLFFIILFSLIKFISILTWIKLVLISLVFLIYQIFGIFNANLPLKTSNSNLTNQYKNINLIDQQNRFQNKQQNEDTDLEYKKFFNFHLKLIYQPIKKNQKFFYCIRFNKYKVVKSFKNSYCRLNKNKNISYSSEFSLLYFMNYFYFCKFLKKNINFYYFLIFIKNYFKLNYYSFVCFLINIIINSNITWKKIKSLILIFSFFGSTFFNLPNNYAYAQQINSNTNNNYTMNTNEKYVSHIKLSNNSAYDYKSYNNNIKNHINDNDINNIHNNKFTTSKKNVDYDCDEMSLKFDYRLFDELNMLQTLNGVYNSCFKDDIDNIERLDKLKEENDNIAGNNHNFKFKLNLKCNRRKTIEIILKNLLNNRKNILSNDLLEKFDSICNIRNRQNDNIGIEDKLYYLSSFKHDLCGNIFRNSFKKRYIKTYILNQNDNVIKQKSKSESSKQKLQIDKNQKISKPKQDFQQEYDHINHRHHYISSPKSSDIELQDENESEISIGADIIDKPVLNLQTDLHLQYATEKQIFHNITKSNPSSTSSSPKLSSSSSAAYPSSNDFIKNTDISLNNCTLILLNSYLLAYKSNCENNEFIEGLSLYDCSSNNFSVKSDCELCKEAYKKWICAINVPYYENNNRIFPCQRYCYNVQHLCPFFRPSDDAYGGQPVFHCMNVIIESDFLDNENENVGEIFSYEENINDKNCYGECTNDLNNKTISIDLDEIFKEILQSDSYSTSSFDFSSFILSDTFTLENVYYLLKLFYQSRNIFPTSKEKIESYDVLNKTHINPYGRFPDTNECLYSFSSASNLKIYNYLVLIIFIFNFSTNLNF